MMNTFVWVESTIGVLPTIYLTNQKDRSNANIAHSYGSEEVYTPVPGQRGLGCHRVVCFVLSATEDLVAQDGIVSR